MGWNYYRKQRRGKWYWYAQRSVRIPGRRMPKTQIVYVGPTHGAPGKHPFADTSGPKTKRADARYKAWLARPEVQESIRAMHEWGRELNTQQQAREELRKLEERENARKPATEAARDRHMALKAEVDAGLRRSPEERASDEYMALRAQQQGQIRAYWKTVEDEVERTQKGNEDWAKEHHSSQPPASSNELHLPSSPASSSEKE